MKTKRRRGTQSAVRSDRRRFLLTLLRTFDKVPFLKVWLPSESDQSKMSLSKCCKKLERACFCDMPQLGGAERVVPRTETEANFVRSANFNVPRLRNFNKESMAAYGKKASEKHAEYKRRAAWIMKLDLLIEEVSIERTESRTLLEAFQPYGCHRESCKFLKMEVDQLEIELESLRQKRALADRFEKQRESYATDRLDWAGLDPHWTGAKPGMAQPPPTSYQGPGRPVRLRHELEEVLYEERFAIQMQRCNSDAATLEREIGRLQALYTKWSRDESAWAKAKRRNEEERLYGMTREDFLGVVCRRIPAAENEASRVARRRTDLMKKKRCSNWRLQNGLSGYKPISGKQRHSIVKPRTDADRRRRKNDASPKQPPQQKREGRTESCTRHGSVRSGH